MAIDEKEIRLRHAKSLLGQIDDTGEQSGFWMVSAISNLVATQPNMTIDELHQIMASEMPNLFRQYIKYLKNT